MTTHMQRPSTRREEEIEQAIARSGSPEKAAERFGLPFHEVLRVWRRMLAASDVPDSRRSAPCGTYRAYKRHLRRKEPPDKACIGAARREAQRRRRLAADYHPRRKPIRHGERAGAASHYRRGEKPCEPCLEAARQYERDRRTAEKGTAA